MTGFWVLGLELVIFLPSLGLLCDHGNDVELQNRSPFEPAFCHPQSPFRASSQQSVPPSPQT